MKNATRNLPLIFALVLMFALTGNLLYAQGRGGRSGGRGGGSSRGGQLSPELALAVVTFEGDLRAVDKKQMRIEQGDAQNLVFRCDKKTKFLLEGNEVKPALMPVPGRVRVDARQVAQGQLYAVRVEALASGEAGKPVSLEQRPSK